jgi:hypothetical protein
MSENSVAADADLSQALYGNTTPGRREAPEPAAAPAQPAQASEGTAADPLQRAEPEPEGEPEGADELEEPSLYDAESIYGATIDADLDELAAQANLPPEHVSALRKGTAQIFEELGIPVAQAAALHSLHVHYLREPASDETEKGWRKEAHAALRARYGAESEQQLAVAREYVKARPGLYQMLLHTGLGSHPRVVREIVERASSWKARNARKGK